jgi:hypothetical protein
MLVQRGLVAETGHAQIRIAGTGDASIAERMAHVAARKFAVHRSGAAS